MRANGKKRGKATSSSSGAGRKKETGKSTAKKQVEPISDLDSTERKLTEGEETEVDEHEVKRLKTSKEKFRICPTL